MAGRCDALHDPAQRGRLLAIEPGGRAGRLVSRIGAIRRLALQTRNSAVSSGSFEVSSIRTRPQESPMPQGDKSSYTDKQKRKAEHIEEGYEKRGVSKKKPRAALGQRSTRSPAAASCPVRADGKRRTMPLHARADGSAGSSQSHAKRSAAAKKGWETRRKAG